MLTMLVAELWILEINSHSVILVDRCALDKWVCVSMITSTLLCACAVHMMRSYAFLVFYHSESTWNVFHTHFKKNKNIIIVWFGPWIWQERAHLNFRWDVLSVDAPTMVAIELEGETTGAVWLQSYKSPLAHRGSLIAIMKISFGASIATMGSLMIILLICEFSQSYRKTEQSHTLSLWHILRVTFSMKTLFNVCAAMWQHRRKSMTQTNWMSSVLARPSVLCHAVWCAIYLDSVVRLSYQSWTRAWITFSHGLPILYVVS